MSWLHLVAIGAAGLASMKASFDAGDLDEAGHQGVLAGPRVVEEALASPDRAIRMAGIAAAPQTDARLELLDALAIAAAGPDRRTAIPAALAGTAIARELARGVSQGDLPDDVATADVLRWRDEWGYVAKDQARWIEVRVAALDTAAALDAAAHAAGSQVTGGIGIDLATALADPDPAFRRAALAVVPVPLPFALRGPLASTLVQDTDPLVALAAAQALCADLVAEPAAPILELIGGPALIRLRSIIATDGASRGTVRDAARCLAADRDPASAAALRTIRGRLR